MTLYEMTRANIQQHLSSLPSHRHSLPNRRPSLCTCWERRRQHVQHIPRCHRWFILHIQRLRRDWKWPNNRSCLSKPWSRWLPRETHVRCLQASTSDQCLIWRGRRSIFQSTMSSVHVMNLWSSVSWVPPCYSTVAMVESPLSKVMAVPMDVWVQYPRSSIPSTTRDVHISVRFLLTLFTQTSRFVETRNTNLEPHHLSVAPWSTPDQTVNDAESRRRLW